MNIVRQQLRFPSALSGPEKIRPTLSTLEKQMLRTLEVGYEFIRERVSGLSSNAREIQVGSAVCSALDLLMGESQSGKLSPKLLHETNQVLEVYLNTCSGHPQAVG